MKSFIKRIRFFSREKSFLFGFYAMFILSIFLTVIETVGIASITTLVSILSSGENYLFEGFISKEINLNFNLILIIIFLIFLIKSFLQISYNFLEAKLTQLMVVKYSKDLFSNFINSQYEINLLKNPSELTRKISSDVEISTSYIFIILQILKEFLILLAIFFLLFFTKTDSVILILGVFGVISILFYKSIKNKVVKLAAKFIKSQSSSIKIINQAFGSLKENIILGINKTLINNFTNKIVEVRKFDFFRSFIKSLPRVIFEFTAVTSIVVIAYILYKSSGDTNYALQVLTLIAVCSVRLIPSFNILTNAFSGIKSYQEIFDKFYNDLSFYERDKTKNEKIDTIKSTFNSSLEFKNVSFKYPNRKNYVIKKGNLKIKKGKIIGIFGKTGEGKTTLIDLIVGLLKKNSGIIKLDNKIIEEKISFSKNSIGYVPQSPFLMDDTIENNIIFGRKVKNKKKLVNDAIKFSQLRNLIKTLPNGIQTKVGNNGVRLSGGQKQRIVIARALLMKPSLLLFDEATSSLDTQTENEIMKEILKLNKITTILIISHKLEIIKMCNIRYFVKKSKIKLIK
jgi:ATP-binding cassette, subfamily B, bacterial PglK